MVSAATIFMKANRGSTNLCVVSCSEVCTNRRVNVENWAEFYFRHEIKLVSLHRFFMKVPSGL